MEQNWEVAEQHLQNIEERIKLISTMPGVNIAFYAGGFASLKSRFDKGERTESLYNEIMALS